MVVKLLILIKKVDSISYEEFHRYWSEEHPKIWGSIKSVQGEGPQIFPPVAVTDSHSCQFHVDTATRDVLAAGLPMADYDGGVEMWANSMEDLMAVYQDEEYLRVVVPDEASFFKREESKMVFGYDELKWDKLKKED